MSGCPPEDEYRFVALDVETANNDRASICQIGLACVDWDNQISKWSIYVDPEVSFSSFNSKLHGINADTVARASAFPDVWGRLGPFLKQFSMVQHSRFDELAINAACQKYMLDIPRLKWTDSVKVAQHAWPQFKGNGGHGLASLKKRLGLSFKHHDAGEDAGASAQIILRAEAVLGDQFAKVTTIPTVRQLQLPLW
ncbi:3'-5' exonuclease [Hirschia litorea]|uniref:3'-5' exonuclease n=1 Tax=Hirschia litorea TaxID=1199156 RepID=A0ABW2INU6_9PROT